MANQRLTAKQKAFCEEYIANGYNATQAYLKSYGCEYSTANNEGCKLLRKPQVKEYVLALQKESFAAACVNAERVALKLAEIAFASKSDKDYSVTQQLKALDLLQKQLGLQHQKIEAEVNNDITINIEE